MKTEILIAGGLGVLALGLLKPKTFKEAITAAEGHIPMPRQIIEDVLSGEKGFGEVISDAWDSGGLTVGGTRTSDIKPVEAAVELPFGGYEFESEKERRKAGYNVAHFEAVTGAGFPWTKQGRYEYKQMLKSDTRQRRAEAAGFETVDEWLESKRAEDSFDAQMASWMGQRAADDSDDDNGGVMGTLAGLAENSTAKTTGSAVGMSILQTMLGGIFKPAVLVGQTGHAVYKAISQDKVPGTELGMGGAAAGAAMEAEIARVEDQRAGEASPSPTSAHGMTSISGDMN